MCQLLYPRGIGESLSCTLVDYLRHTEREKCKTVNIIVLMIIIDNDSYSANSSKLLISAFKSSLLALVKLLK